MSAPLADFAYHPGRSLAEDVAYCVGMATLCSERGYQGLARTYSNAAIDAFDRYTVHTQMCKGCSTCVSVYKSRPRKRHTRKAA